MQKIVGIIRSLVATVSMFALAACSGGDGGDGGASTSSSSPTAQVSGAVLIPGGQVAFTPPSLWERIAGIASSDAVAALSGLSVAADGTEVRLARIDERGNIAATLASTAVSKGRYSFDLASLGVSPSSNLVVRVANSGTGAQMRAFVTGSTVDLDPVSEAAVRLALDQIKLVPGMTLNQFTIRELADLTGGVGQLAALKQLTAGLNIETTVTAIKTAAANEAGLQTFLIAAAGPGETPEGPGDIGNFFPLTQSSTWEFQGAHSVGGALPTNFSNTMAVKGPIQLPGVNATVVSESNSSASGPEDVYYVKDSRGIMNHGTNRPDPLTSNLVPYREIVFPLNPGETRQLITRTGVTYAQDLDGDGRLETANVISEFTVEKFEDVTVPLGSFTNTAKVIHKTILTVISSAGFGSVTVTGTQTTWFAPGVGPVKRKLVIEEDGQVTDSIDEELVNHYFSNFGPVVFHSSNGSNYYQAAVGDLNGDGRGDVALTVQNPTSVRIFYQDSQGNLSPFTALNISSSLTSVSRIAVGDLNNDGKADLVVTGACVACARGADGRVVIYYQHPTNGSLLSGKVIQMSANLAASAAIGDINGDGRRDLVVVNLQGSLSIYYQLPNGSLGAEVIYDKVHGDLSTEIHIADMDNDGDQDIVTQDFRDTQGQFSVVKQDSTVTPGILSNSPETYQIPGGFRAFDLGDVNGDGRNDVVVWDYVNLTLSVFLQSPTGTLQAPFALPSFNGSGVKIADVNADGLNDLLSNAGNNLVVLLQAPNHTFGKPIFYHYQSEYIGIGEPFAVGDITGDNKPDAVLTHSSLGLFVLPNTTQ